MYAKKNYIEYYGKTISFIWGEKRDILEKQKFSNIKCFQKFEIF